MLFYLSFALSLFQIPQATPWEELKKNFTTRIQGEDFKDRDLAIQETVATGDIRAFEILFDGRSAILERKDACQRALDNLNEEMKSLSQQKDGLSNRQKKLILQKRLKNSEMEELNRIPQYLAGLESALKKQQIERSALQTTLTNLQNIERAILEGAVTLLQTCSPVAFENYRKAFARSIGFPGSYRESELYVELLGKSQRQEAFPYLETFLRQGNGKEAAFSQAAKGMISISKSKATPILIQFLGHSNLSVKKAAHENLRASWDQFMSAEQELWQKWWESQKGDAR